MDILIITLIFGGAFAFLGMALGYSLVKGEYVTTGTAVVIACSLWVVSLGYPILEPSGQRRCVT